jgi:hypothetical protein
MMTYDPVKGSVLLVDPCDGVSGAVWTFASNAWTRQGSLPSGPSGEVLASTYDAAAGYTMFIGCPGAWNYSCEIGGYNDPYIPAVFAYVAGNWTSLPIPATLYSGGPLSAVFDPALGAVILYDGQTWSYIGGDWKQLPMSHAPPLRSDFGMAYDPTDRRVVLFGGCCVGSSNVVMGDTWTFNGTDWTNLTGALGGVAPPPASGVGMATDPGGNGLILFGGYLSSTTGQASNQTWRFVNDSWSRLSLPSGGYPSARYDAQMATDSADGSIVLMGGQGDVRPWVPFNDTWIFRNGSWSDHSNSSGIPMPRLAYGSIANDPVFGGVVMLTPYGWTFHYSAGRWTNLTGSAWPTPGARYEMAMTFDARDGYVLLQGGLGYSAETVPLSDTWIWRGEGSPSPPRVLALAITPTHPEVGVPLSPAASVSGGTGNLSFDWVGLPAGCDSRDSFEIDCVPIGSGPRHVSLIVTDEFDESALANLSFSVAAVITLVSFQAIPGSFQIGGASNLSALVLGGVPPISFRYLGLPPGCNTSNLTSLSCVPTITGLFTVSVLATDSNDQTVIGTTTLTVTATPPPPPPDVLTFFVSPTEVQVGNSTDFTATVTGGLAPLSFYYSGLPGGCLSENRSSLMCSPRSPGSFLVTIVVLDGLGRTSEAQAELTVDPIPTQPAEAGPPVIDFFFAIPTSVTLGSATSFFVGTSGGTLPLSFSFAGLPSGCRSINVSQLPCTPAGSVGSFNVTVTVKDASGRSATSTAKLSVVPDATQGTPTASSPGLGGDGWLAPLIGGAAIGAMAATLVIAVLWSRKKDGPRRWG